MKLKDRFFFFTLDADFCVHGSEWMASQWTLCALPASGRTQPDGTWQKGLGAVWSIDKSCCFAQGETEARIVEAQNKLIGASRFLTGGALAVVGAAVLRCRSYPRPKRPLGGSVSAAPDVKNIQFIR